MLKNIKVAIFFTLSKLYHKDISEINGEFGDVENDISSLVMG